MMRVSCLPLLRKAVRNLGFGLSAAFSNKQKRLFIVHQTAFLSKCVLSN